MHTCVERVGGARAACESNHSVEPTDEAVAEAIGLDYPYVCLSASSSIDKKRTVFLIVIN
jgi:hypothetical protein